MKQKGYSPVLIRRLYAGKLVVWSVEWLAKLSTHGRTGVMAVHNAATEALDS